MAKISSNSRQAAEAIGRKEAFTTHGALRAEAGKVGPWDSGRLSGADHEAFRADMPNIDYVVYSYATPIAWTTTDGKVHKVAQKFSVTTSKHQGKLYLLGQ